MIGAVSTPPIERWYPEQDGSNGSLSPPAEHRGEPVRNHGLALFYCPLFRTAGVRWSSHGPRNTYRHVGFVIRDLRATRVFADGNASSAVLSAAVGVIAERIRALGTVTTVPVAAAIFGLSRSVAYDLVKAGTFPVPVLRFGSRYRIPVAAILTVLHMTGEPPTGT